MQSKWAVILTGAVLCCIPAVVFLGFGGQNEKYPLPVQHTSWPVEAKNHTYQAILQTKNRPIKTGEQHLSLTVISTNKPAKPILPITISVEMSMGNHTMTAPTQIKQQDTAHYQIKTNFEMAGDWYVKVTPWSASSSLILPFNVEAGTQLSRVNSEAKRTVMAAR